MSPARSSDRFEKNSTVPIEAEPAIPTHPLVRGRHPLVLPTVSAESWLTWLQCFSRPPALPAGPSAMGDIAVIRSMQSWHRADRSRMLGGAVRAALQRSAEQVFAAVRHADRPSV